MLVALVCSTLQPPFKGKARKSLCNTVFNRKWAIAKAFWAVTSVYSRSIVRLRWFWNVSANEPAICWPNCCKFSAASVLISRSSCLYSRFSKLPIVNSDTPIWSKCGFNIPQNLMSRYSVPEYSHIHLCVLDAFALFLPSCFKRFIFKANSRFLQHH